MTLRLSTPGRNAALDAVTALCGTAGVMEIRTGAQPATADDAATGTLLATFNLANPAFAAAAAGSAAADTTPALTATGVANGDAGWFRIRSSAGTKIVDGSVTATGGGGQLQLGTVTVSIGLDLSVTAFTLTQAG